MVSNLAKIVTIFLVSNLICVYNFARQPSVYHSINPANFLFRFQEKFNELNVFKNLTNQNSTRKFSEDSSDYEDIVTKPTLTGTKPPNKNDDLNEYIIVNLNKGPQSLTVLMNFQSDGVSTVKILNEHMVYWTDVGYCKHGQVYDPLVGLCRDVFCTQGYIFTNKGCVLDRTQNKTNYLPIKQTPNQLEIELTLSHVYCVHELDLNVTVPCNHPKIMNYQNFISEFKTSLSKTLQVIPERIDQLKIIHQEKVNETILIKNKSQLSSVKYLAQIEQTKLSFLLKDYQQFPDEKIDTMVLFYYLSRLAMSNKVFPVMRHNLIISDVMESSQSTNRSLWCNAPNKKLFVKSEFRILAYFDATNKPRYYVFLNQTDTLYGVGYFYLTVAYIPKQTYSTRSKQDGDYQFDEGEDVVKFADDENNDELKTIYWNLTNNPIITDDDYFQSRNLTFISLKDVTDVVLEKYSNQTYTTNLLTVCNRAPKIRVDCVNHETIRIKLCEMKLMKNQSYCSTVFNICFSINEYEYDELKPEDFIRICKYKPTISSTNLIHSYQDLKKNLLDKSSDVANSIPGWVSLFSVIVSIFFMLATLLTYSLFKELRNIPGWNMINLTTALTVAEVSFLTGSLSTSSPLICFLASLLTHYGFLTSFFWMNVIAFDLYRNFRKSSNVLLTNVSLKGRLSKYAIYGWLLPLIIVLISLTIDLSSSETASFRPCYAGYLKGCVNHHNITLNLNDTSTTLNKPNKTSFNDTEVIECYGEYKQVYLIAILSQTCWIESGKATLLFFGVPVGVIIVLNGVFYFLTICNIRKLKARQRQSLRRFSKAKLPGDDDVKFYIQIAFIMGFTWSIGFFLTTVSPENSSYPVIYQILIYLFILSNASIGVFIFFLFIFKKETFCLYKKLLRGLLASKRDAPITVSQTNRSDEKKRKSSVARLVSSESNVTSGESNAQVIGVFYKNLLFTNSISGNISSEQICVAESKTTPENCLTNLNDPQLILRV